MLFIIFSMKGLHIILFNSITNFGGILFLVDKLRDSGPEAKVSHGSTSGKCVWTQVFSSLWKCESLSQCLTLYDPIDYSLPGSSPWDFLVKNSGVDYQSLLQGIFLTQGLDPTLQADSLPSEPPGNPFCIVTKHTSLSHPPLPSSACLIFKSFNSLLYLPWWLRR